MTDSIEPLRREAIVTGIAFSDVAIGEEFWWGSYYPHRMNWGRKRSTRTADWRGVLSGEMSSHTTWGYWRANETVYVTR